jgi:primosomal replication protein N''
VRHPTAEIDRQMPLEVIQVNGLYEARTNKEEAERVVELLASIWRQRKGQVVVTFNRDQADLIEQCLEERAEEDEAFRAAYIRERQRMQAGEDISFFVKNVENVQGDERDQIIFSTTFGRNRSGLFRRNFGVLGQSGGERRLNVAVTRARHKVTILTSMPLDEISGVLGTGACPRQPRDFLQLYLAYAVAISRRQHEVGHRLLDQTLKE